MSACDDGCPREETQQDPISIGPIGGSEIIARGGHSPRHGDAVKRKPRAALIRGEDLLSGNYSVWRIEPTGIACMDLVDRLSGVPGQTLFALFAISAEEIRRVRTVAGDRAFFVVDECECDAEGNKHPAHAHIGICSALIDGGLKREDEVFEQARQDLYGLLKTNPIWYILPSLAA